MQAARAEAEFSTAQGLVWVWPGVVALRPACCPPRAARSHEHRLFPHCQVNTKRARHPTPRAAALITDARGCLPASKAGPCKGIYRQSLEAPRALQRREHHQHAAPTSALLQSAASLGQSLGRDRRVQGQGQVPCSQGINQSDKYALTSIMLLSCSAKK